MNNKRLLRDRNFPFPLTITLFTLVFNYIAGAVLVNFFGVELKNKALIDKNFYIQKVLPIGFLTAATIVLGMSSYMFLTVSFVQMLKAFTPVMTLSFLFLFRLNTPTNKQFYCVLLICLGTFIASCSEVNFNFYGAFFMISAQMCEALKLVFTQKVLQVTKVAKKEDRDHKLEESRSFLSNSGTTAVLSSSSALKSPDIGGDESDDEETKQENRIKFSVFESLYYISPSSAIFVLLFALLFEFPNFFYSENEILTIFFINFHLFFLSGILAIFTNLINWVVIQKTDALNLKLMATARNALLILFNSFVLNEEVTKVQFFGYSMSLLGFISYNYFKLTQQPQR